MDCSVSFFNSPDAGAATAATAASLRNLAITLKGTASDVRQATHLVFVLDISESMDDFGGAVNYDQYRHRTRDQDFPSKLASVKRSIEFITPLLTPRDMVSIITFGEDSTIHLTAEQMEETGKANVLRKVRELRTNGCTNMSAGLLDVQRLLDDMNALDYPAHKHGILLLTDGLANRGQTKTDQLLSIIQKIQIKYPALTFSTFGYGKDHNTDLLQQIAATGGGSYNVVYSLEDVATTFGEVLGGLTSVVAQNVKIFLPDGSEPMTGYAVDSSASSQVTVKVGDIYAENEVIVLSKIPSNTDTIRISWTELADLSFHDKIFQIFPAELETPKAIQIALYRQKVATILKNAPTVSHRRVAEVRLEVQDLFDYLRELPFRDDMIIQMLCDDLRSVLEGFDRGMTQEHATEVSQHAAYLSMGRGLRSVMPASAAGAPGGGWAATPIAAASSFTIPMDDEDDPTSPMTRGGGAGRGPHTAHRVRLSQPAAAGGGAGSEEPQTPPPTAHFAASPFAASPFSNPVQRRITQQIRESLSQQAEEQEQ